MSASSRAKAVGKEKARKAKVKVKAEKVAESLKARLEKVKESSVFQDLEMSLWKESAENLPN